MDHLRKGAGLAIIRPPKSAMKVSFPPGFHPRTLRIPGSGGSIWQDFPGVCLIGKLMDSGPPAKIPGF
jgi:hypothetical protein